MILSLKDLREKEHLSLRNVSLQTGLSPATIQAAENEPALDLGVLFILNDFYQITSVEYLDWLQQLQPNQAVILQEIMTNPADKFLYSAATVEKITPQKIYLTNQLHLDKATGRFTYSAPNGSQVTYKIFPPTTALNTSKTMTVLQTILGLDFL